MSKGRVRSSWKPHRIVCAAEVADLKLVTRRAKRKIGAVERAVRAFAGNGGVLALMRPQLLRFRLKRWCLAEFSSLSNEVGKGGDEPLGRR